MTQDEGRMITGVTSGRGRTDGPRGVKGDTGLDTQRGIKVHTEKKGQKTDKGRNMT